MTLAERSVLADFRLLSWPEDFGRRLERLKELAGLSWQEMVALLGVTDRATLLWRRGERLPSGANILAVTDLARSIPGGIELLCRGDAGALTLWGRDWESGGTAVSSGMSGAARYWDLRFPAPSLPQDFPVRLGRVEDRSGTSLEELGPWPPARPPAGEGCGASDGLPAATSCGPSRA